MKMLEAIQYLVTNDPSFDEWSEAGMWDAVRKIVKEDPNKQWNSKELKELIQKAN